MIELLDKGIGKEVRKFTCSICKAVFRTDEYSLTGTKSMAISEYLPIIDVVTFECECPQCRSRCTTNTANPSDRYIPPPAPPDIPERSDMT